jgi:hypothetical protein
MASKDPFLWTCEELAHQICYSTGDCFDAAGHIPFYVQDRKDVASAMHKMGMTGEGFLTIASAEALRSSFSTASLDHMRALAAYIKVLRQKSPMYQQHLTLTKTQDLRLDDNDDPSALPERSEPTAPRHPEPQGRRRVNLSTITTEPLPKTTGHRSTTEGEAQNPVSDDWSHLLRWTQEGDDEEMEEDEPDTYTDEEDLEDIMEVEEDEPDETTQSAGAPGSEVRGQRKSTTKLSEEQVVDIINERIEHYAQRWRPRKEENTAQPPDPLRIWEDAEAEGRRPQMAESKKLDVQYFSDRLDNICHEIAKDPWNSVKEVRSICGTLAGTVEQLEEAKWYHDIYALQPVDDSEDDGEAVEIIDLGSGSESSQPDERLSNVEPSTKAVDSELPRRTARPVSTPVSLHGPTNTANVRHPVPQPFGHSSSTPGGVRHGRHPETASIHAVSQWDMDDLIAKADRKRIVMKVVHKMPAGDRELIRTRVQTVRKQDLLAEVAPCVTMLLRGEKRMRGVLQRDTYKIVAFTRLFLCWWMADDYFNSHKKEPTEWQLEELAGNLEDGCTDLEYCYNWVRHILENTFNQEALRTPGKPSQPEVIEISSDED